MSVGRITKNASAIFVGKFISSGLGIVFSFLIARIMLPEEFGIIALAISTIWLILPFVDIGVNQSLIYFIPRTMDKKADLKALINKGVLIKSCLGLVFSVLFVLSAGIISSAYNEPLLVDILRILSFVSLAYPLFLTLQAVFIGFQKMFYIMYTNVSFSVFKFLAIPLFIIGGLVGAAYGYLLGYVLSLGVALLFFIKIYPRGAGAGKFETKRFAQMSGGMFLATLFSNMASPLLLMLIGLFSSSEQVAFMEISVAIGMLISFTAVALGTSMRPTIIRISEKATLETIKRISKYMILSTVPLAVLAISLRTSLIRFIYGPNYMAATSTMGWTAVGFCIYGCFMSFYSVAQAMGKWRELAINYILSFLAVLVLGLFLVPSEGSVGAGKVFVISVIMGTAYIVIKFREIGYPIDILSKAVVASAAMLIPILAIWDWTFGIYKLLAGGLLGIGTYLLVVFAVKGLDSEDIRLLKKLFTKLRERI